MFSRLAPLLFGYRIRERERGREGADHAGSQHAHGTGHSWVSDFRLFFLKLLSDAEERGHSPPAGTSSSAGKELRKGRRICQLESRTSKHGRVKANTVGVTSSSRSTVWCRLCQAIRLRPPWPRHSKLLSHDEAYLFMSERTIRASAGRPAFQAAPGTVSVFSSYVCRDRSRTQTYWISGPITQSHLRGRTCNMLRTPLYIPESIVAAFQKLWNKCN